MTSRDEGTHQGGDDVKQVPWEPCPMCGEKNVKRIYYSEEIFPIGGALGATIIGAVMLTLIVRSPLAILFWLVVALVGKLADAKNGFECRACKFKWEGGRNHEQTREAQERPSEPSASEPGAG